MSASPRWEMSSERSESRTASRAAASARVELAARREDVRAGGELPNLRGDVVGRGPRRGEVGVPERLVVAALLDEREASSAAAVEA